MRMEQRDTARCYLHGDCYRMPRGCHLCRALTAALHRDIATQAKLEAQPAILAPIAQEYVPLTCINRSLWKD